ncbi:MAG TPA: serine hydrolase [Leptolyngbyaceae cyanobacterium]
MIRATIKNVWFCVFCFSLLTIGCTSSNSINKAENQDSQTNALEKVVASNANNKLGNQIEQISHTAQGRVGVTATVLETGARVTLNGNQQFPMQSVYKFPIGMAVLAQVDRGKLSLDRRVSVKISDFVSNLQHSPIRDKYPQGVELSLAELLEYMVSESDGTACDVLLNNKQKCR